MKKILLMIVPLMALIGCSYDDTDIQKRLDDLDGQLTELQALVKALNSDVTTLKELVAGKRFISDVQPGEDGGYVITLVTAAGETSKITISDGKDGTSSVIGVKQDSDGVYYWTLNGDFILDNGKKLPVSGVTPEFKIENSHWWISYDNGATWTDCGQAQTDQNLFKSVATSEDGKLVYLTLADGTVLTFELYVQFGIAFDTAQLKANFGFVSGQIESGKILSAWSVGFGGVAEGLAKMAFGNRIGAEVTTDESRLYEYAYGSILVESDGELDFPAAELLGATVADEALTVNGVRMPLDGLYEANTVKFTTVYPDKGENRADVMSAEPARRTFAYEGEAVERPVAYLPVFPGTNCDYDTAKAFRNAGAEVTTSVLCNLGGDDILRSIAQMKEHIRRAHIFVLCGGFSSGDEPDGSAKFIVNVLNNKDIREEIHALLDRGGLILGICNGFQALVKSGLLPYGRLGMVTKDSPTLFRNDVNRHISQIVSTRVSTLNSPWLAGFGLGDIHSIAVSHGEGKFVVSEELARELFANGQVAFQYVDPEGRATAEAPYNPNGSSYAIEGLVSRDGQILGKMGHTERYEKNLFKNIAGEKEQSLFRNAVEYFRKSK